MPHLVFRGVKEGELKKVSASLVNRLGLVLEVPEDHFTLEVSNSSFINFHSSSHNPTPVIVDVFWFPRREGLAKRVTDVIMGTFKPSRDFVSGSDRLATLPLKETPACDVAARGANAIGDVVVIFHELNPSFYFENGKSF